ncbi:unnamed protein product [Paramecium octaurelia]|uniref:Proteasome subunit beta n=1 Tax=Paramecium octaurelia TaxID=43137 RepID=A0A8S1V1Y2_PAROT|nr:unnamed protein product [Paramecium octaurelia]
MNYTDILSSKFEPETTGTTIMAVIYDGGLIIGADSRTSSGQFVADRCADKIDYIHDRIFCLRSGSAADTQIIAKHVRYYIDAHAQELGRLPAVATAANLFRNFLYEYKDSLSAAIIVAGWDPYKGPQIFTLPLGGSVIEQKWSIGGSGSTFIWGFCDSNYKENMTLQQAKAFVLHAVAHAMFRDGSSGGIIRLLNVTKDKIEREFIDYKDVPVK